MTARRLHARIMSSSITNESQPEFSVVIASHTSDPVRFARVLSALKRAVQHAGSTETLVVRNGGPAIPQEVLVAGPPLTLLDEERLGIAWARAAGIGASQGRYIVFVDDDNVVDDAYLTNIRAFIRSSPSVGVFGGRIDGEFAVAPHPAIKPALPFLALRDLGKHKKEVLPAVEPSFDVPGAGMVLRRDVALAFCAMVEDGNLAGIGRAGGSLASCDDTACCLIARRMGLSLAYVPELCLTHIIPETRLEPVYLRRLVRSIGASAARLDAVFYGPESLRVLSYPQLLARIAVHVARSGVTGGLITSGWHVGYREQALRELDVRARQTT